MSEIKRFDIPRDGNEFMHEDPDGEYVLYDDHLAEMFRMRAEVERLTQELDGRRATNQRVIAERDAARANSIEDARLKNDIISRLVKQRDAMQAEIERLRANGQGMLDTSRPTDEDIWREAFMMAMQQGRVYDRITVADLALSEYRNRWPR